MVATGASQELTAALTQLASDALLANPLPDFERLLLIQRQSNNLGLPQNWEGNSNLPRGGFDNQIVELAPVRPNGELRPLFRPEAGPACVTIDRPFWIGRCEVSNEQYARFDPAHDSRIERGDFLQFDEKERGYPANNPKQPVVRVSWNAAMEFCRWLAATTGEQCTLPSEAQWEYACRAGTATPLWFGGLDTDFSKFANLADHTLRAIPTFSWGLPSGGVPPWRPAIDSINDGFRIGAPVGSFASNAWNLRDMSGNVWEWTSGEFSHERKAVRGGSWSDRPQRATSSSRQGYRPWQQVHHVGFRVMIAPPGNTNAAAATTPLK
jgi:formylglycine-generating enzyme required for sulfatase activity